MCVCFCFVFDCHFLFLWFLNRGFGFVTFADASCVDKVLAQHLHELDSKRVRAPVLFAAGLTYSAFLCCTFFFLFFTLKSSKKMCFFFWSQLMYSSGP